MAKVKSEEPVERLAVVGRAALESEPVARSVRVKSRPKAAGRIVKRRAGERKRIAEAKAGNAELVERLVAVGRTVVVRDPVAQSEATKTDRLSGVSRWTPATFPLKRNVVPAFGTPTILMK
ncbi:hypothetical protein [Paenibacillus sp. J31TS4]|uniref:hypothetical protein n=1 Tax=Paenibacillus sp. J31TS4 TaxID=2807195 RepID=UPI0020BD6F7B|nr:hypothetical protein [Paenibacillus sp. J31TS4]